MIENKTIIAGEWKSRQVYLNGRYISPRPSQGVWNHSPDGFSWGYAGSGPAQLALAILLKFTDRETAIRLHQRFKQQIIAPLPQASFRIEINVAGWVNEQLRIDKTGDQGL
jgi:hypothetical protein